MTPTTLIIDRTFKGVGRIKKATGTTIPAVRRKMSRMLTVLAEEGRIDILRAIRDGQLTLLQVLDAYQRKALEELPTADTVPLLADAMQGWLDGLKVPDDCSAKHKTSLGTSRKYFLEHAPKATIADIAVVLGELRKTLGAEYPRSFNLTRAAALAFLRDTLKKNHPLWLAVAAVQVRRVAKRAKRPAVTPDVLRNFFPDPATDPVDAIAWGMATTGMGPKEYFENDWEVRSDRVHIAGTKREGRVRDVPLTHAPAVPQLHRRTFEDKVRDRTNRVLEPYDLRRTFSRWMESAGIPRTRRRLYMGHGAQDVTDLYEAHEVAAFLTEDAAKLRQFLGQPAPTGAAPRIRLERAD